MVRATKFWLMSWTYGVLPSTVCHAAWRKTNVIIEWRFVVTWSVVLTMIRPFSYDDPTFLNWIITGGETWCFLYDSQLKRQSAIWKTAVSSRQKITATRQVRRQGDAWSVFYSIGIVHMEFIPEGATVNKTRYKEILGRLSDSIHHKRPELWRRKNWLFATWQRPCTSLYPCPRGACNRLPFCHTSVLTWCRIMRFLSLSPHESTPK